MATYYSNKIVLNSNGVNIVQPKWLEDREVVVVATTSFASGTTLNSGDTIQIADIPAGVQITDIVLDSDKLDTGGSPAITLSVGDATVTNRFFNAATTAQAGGVQEPNVAGFLGTNYAATTRIYATVGTGAAGATSGAKALRVAIRYSADA